MKALKFLGVAVLACSMLFVSCKKDQNYTITVKADPVEGGTVTGGGSYAANATATLTATANAGYEFTGWSDGTTNNPRTITVTKSETYTAKFKAVSTTGAKISFNGETWTATSIDASVYNSDGYIAYSINKTEDQYPVYVGGYLEIAPGTYDYAGTQDMMCYYDPNYTYVVTVADTAIFGAENLGAEMYGWGIKVTSFTETVVAVDLNAHWTSATFSVDLYSYQAAHNLGWTAYPELKQLIGDMNQATWTASAKKANAIKKDGPTFRRVK